MGSGPQSPQIMDTDEAKSAELQRNSEGGQMAYSPNNVEKLGGSISDSKLESKDLTNIQQSLETPADETDSSSGTSLEEPELAVKMVEPSESSRSPVTWQEEAPYERKSPELVQEAESLDDSDHIDDGAVDVDLVVDEPVLDQDPKRTAAIMEDVMEKLTTEENPVGVLHAIQQQTTSFFSGANDEIESYQRTIQKNKALWDWLPIIVECFLKRTKPFSMLFYRVDPSTGMAGPELALEFLSNFARLTSKMVQKDLGILRRFPHREQIDLISVSYVNTVTLMLRPDAPLFGLFKYDRGSVFVPERMNIAFRFCKGTGGISAFREIIEVALDRVPKQPDLLQSLLSYVQATQICLSLCHRLNIMDSDAEESSVDMNPLEDILADFTSLFLTFERGFRKLIESHLAAVTTKNITWTYEIMGEMARVLGSENFSGIISGLGVENVPSDLPTVEQPCFAEWCWKFPLCLAFINTSKLDLRIYGIQRLQDGILRMYKEVVDRVDVKESALLKYVGTSLQSKRVVEYLVGAGSHPELTRRCTSILQFLVITNQLTSDIREALWRPLVENKDSRTVGATMSLIEDSSPHNWTLELCVDYCKRASAVPVASFEANMPGFIRKLVDVTLQACENDPEQKANAEATNSPLTAHVAIYDMLIAFLKSAVIVQEDSAPAKVPPSWVMATLRDDLYRISQYGPSSSEKQQILLDALDDIRSKRKTATASIMVLVAFLRPKAEQILQLSESEAQMDVLELFSDSKLHVAVVEELRFFVQEHQELHSNYVVDALRIRMDLIEIMIYIYPQGLTEDLSFSLWECLVGTHAIGSNEREAALQELASLAQNTITLPEKNIRLKPFFQTLFTQFFPQLPAEHFSLPALHFCCRALEYINEHPEVNSDGIIQPKGIEQIWRVILCAPPHLERISQEAIGYMVKYYFDSLASFDTGILQETHFALVTSCISHLKSTTSTLEGSQASADAGDEMAVDLTEEDKTRTHLEFQRSVELLSALIKGYRVRPHCTNPRTATGRGEPIKIRCQIMGNKIPANTVHFLECWADETYGTLFDRIARILNANNFRVIYNGGEIHLMAQPEKLVRELGLLPAPNFIIMVRPDASGISPSSATNTALELEVLKHFDEFYGLLVLPEPYGAMIWKLLREFPIQKQVAEIFEADSIDREKWPTGHSWQIQYFIAALKNRLHQLRSLDKFEERTRFNREAILLLLSGLADPAVSGIGSTQGLRTELTLDYLQTLLNLLKEQTVRLDISEAIGSPNNVIQSLLSILTGALGYTFAEENSVFANLAVTAFELLFLLTDKCQLWEHLVAFDSVPGVLGTALLVHRAPVIRRTASEILLNFCQDAQDISLSRERALYFWNIFQRSIFPSAEGYAFQALEFVKLTTELFKYLALRFPELIDVKGYFQDWATRVIEYQYPEPLSTVYEDYLFYGYVQLTHQCLKLAFDLGEELQTATLIQAVFWTYLFTPYSDEDQITTTGEKFPVISSLARNELYKLILSALPSAGWSDLLDSLLDLFPSDGYLAEGWNLDRSRWLVSSAGYLGMKNLANTCYLNSLMTQLFMNTQFRKFIFDAEVEDYEKQNLLVALKGMFGEMQGGKSKFVDPTPLAAAIRDHEDNEIDVTVQMDVDEFFNLLFDRLEGQMPSKTVKDKFRALYGGNLVQQVKSRECPHISEREEPFSAIQCDIKGKANLVESLQAYVEGDVMEGDNKYSCSQCNKHVDAVKRACLKDIPDNLIFHLKRFDFDLETMQRRKINDRFEFPETIDMRPYTVQYLSNPESSMTPDVFELVGVLVHTGSAESGHYYSYMKDHDAETSYNGRPQWLQFNDSEVSDFDYTTLGDCCFGGMNDLAGMNNHVLGPKPYSAYMLFYKRIDSPGTISMSRRSLEYVPEDLKMRILQENEEKVRKYCMFDNDFVLFVLDVAKKAHAGDDDDDHAVGIKATNLMLDTVCNITARIKDCAPGNALIGKLKGIIGNCVHCSRVVLTWACLNEYNTRAMIIKCPLMRIRGTFTDLIFEALRCLSGAKDCYLELYGVPEEPQNPQEYAQFLEADGYIQKLFDIMVRNAKVLQSTYKSWDDFFAILLHLLSAGTHAVALFLHRNLLVHTLNLFYGEYHLRGNGSQFRAPERNRKPSYQNLLCTLAFVMDYLDLTKNYEPVDDDEDEWSRIPVFVDGQPRFAVTPEEKSRLLVRDKNGDSPVVYKFIYRQLEQNGIDPDSTKRIVQNWLTRYRSAEVRRRIRDTLLGGISLDPASEAGPFLDCLVIYVGLSDQPADVAEIIERVASDVGTIQNSGGREHLDFFKNLRHMQSDQLSEGIISDKVVDTIPQWAPALLTFCEPEVRHETYALIDECLFLERENAASEGEARRLSRIIDALCRECFEFVEKRYLKQKDLSQNTDSRALDEVVRVLRKCKDPETNPENERRIQGMLDARDQLGERRY
ncbi:hypothetical protein BJ508DRAFT_320601 [Ascobolus immersus RN42]|uniref:USP domain-containing protein n=1 Tax=Ascobolus immersus RN42 TaxID=1160509 RepID=A0A3N4IPB0_ASCIM|nr:hypothetical protein BJ508DRAFT_320601 [Ascobolus immersus RN42]